MNNNYITITEVNKYIKEIINDDLLLKKVYLKGEISNFKAHSRGHYYFTLKDENSRIAAVMFSFNNKNLKFVPYDGMKVLVTGKIDVYESTGSYQIYVEDMSPDGIGALYVAFEELKKKLSKEGLFDKEKKKKIRRIPRKIGIVTSPTGAAIKDILTTIKRRYPVCETILFPALVQGEEAAADIAKKIKLANNVKDIYNIDTLIVGRGGGSLEDLWPFNEEVVARAIYDSDIPVISAVGHEIDITISDYVADLRAPTPTAAGELAVPDINTITTYLNTAIARSYNALNNIVTLNYKKLDNLKNSYILSKPMSMYEIKEQKLDILMDNLDKAINKVLENTRIRLYTCSNSYILNNPDMLYKYSSQKLEHIISKLNVLNPLNTLNRGYAIVKKDNKVLSSINNFKNNDSITISLKDGDISAKITKVGE
ncbi:MAG: exodeoxyribonuclease VII large subunit [Bacilli bacterium]|nr:exodeoxyribonuclease VII large subunit [Bacilli bacterium]